MRNKNGYGGIVKLKGKRRKPYMAYISEMQADGVIIPQQVKDAVDNASTALQVASDPQQAAAIYADALVQLYALTMSPAECIAALQKQLADELQERTFKSKQRRRPLGYFATSSEANIALAEYNKKPYDLDGRKSTFAEIYKLAYEDAKIANKGQSTINAYRAAYNKCQPLWNEPLASIKLIQLQAIVDAHSNRSLSLQSNIIMVQKLVYEYSCKNDIVEKNYSDFVKINDYREAKKKVPFTRAEIAALWNRLDWVYIGTKKSILKGEPVADILLILIYTGLRIDELLNTASSDVHLEERYITIRGTKTANAERLVPIHRDIEPLIKKRLARGGENLICTAAGKNIKYNNFNNSAFPAFCRAFGAAHTLHDTRHTFATYTTRLDPTLRAFIIGHTTGSLTNDLYTHPEMLLPELLEQIDSVDFLND